MLLPNLRHLICGQTINVTRAPKVNFSSYVRNHIKQKILFFRSYKSAVYSYIWKIVFLYYFNVSFHQIRLLNVSLSSNFFLLSSFLLFLFFVFEFYLGRKAFFASIRFAIFFLRLISSNLKRAEMRNFHFVILWQIKKQQRLWSNDIPPPAASK